MLSYRTSTLHGMQTLTHLRFVLAELNLEA